MKELSRPGQASGPGRKTRNSRAAGLPNPKKTKLSIPDKYKDDTYKGTYAYERHHGSTRINKGRSHPIKVEADHAPTDGSQRGGLARDSTQNRLDTLERTAFTVPERWHRKHPTTGSRDGGEMAHAQKVMSGGYPHVGDDKSAERRGRALGFEMHVSAYKPIVESGPKYGSGVFEGVQEGVSNAIGRMQKQHGLSSAQVEHLEEVSKTVFSKPVSASSTSSSSNSLSPLSSPSPSPSSSGRSSPRLSPISTGSPRQSSAGSMRKSGIFPTSPGSSGKSPHRGTKMKHYSSPSHTKAWR